jgi:hypothetical protein
MYGRLSPRPQAHDDGATDGAALEVRS